jgi:hypothetical protein
MTSWWGLRWVLLACLVWAAWITRDRWWNPLRCVTSHVDGEVYCVRDRPRVQHAADLLAKVTQTCKEVVVYCGRHHPDDPRVQRLVAKFNPQVISETLPSSEHTAYSENKGEKLAFCLNRHNHDRSKLIDESTLTFVALHEMAHIMTVSEGHKHEFWSNFKFLLEQAKEGGLYTPVNYKQNPQPYCGMDITDNPFYDFN